MRDWAAAGRRRPAAVANRRVTVTFVQTGFASVGGGASLVWRLSRSLPGVPSRSVSAQGTCAMDEIQIQFNEHRAKHSDSDVKTAASA